MDEAARGVARGVGEDLIAGDRNIVPFLQRREDAVGGDFEGREFDDLGGSLFSAELRTGYASAGERAQAEEQGRAEGGRYERSHGGVLGWQEGGR